MASKKVVLEKTVLWFDKNIREIEIREPSCTEYFDFGEAQIWARSADGGIFSIEQTAVVKQYLDRCLNIENGAAIFSLLSLKDGQRIKAALFGFFSDAGDLETSNQDGSNSSST
jgi:hypothetical protein